MSEASEIVVPTGKDGSNTQSNRLDIHFLKPDEQSDNVFILEVSDPEDSAEVSSAVAKRAEKEYWFLSPDYQNERLRDKYEIVLGNNTVELYNFQEKPLTTRQVELIAHSLAVLHSRIKNADEWRLQSIQVRSQVIENGKSGEPTRGLENPEQRRFELFPASFEEGKYREEIDCTWLEGTTLHEATHVILERTLQSLWEKHREKLGWTFVDDTLIELPGGILTTIYNRFPSRCPTEYAIYQPDDDRAESVVQLLVDEEKLDSVRKQILDEVFQSHPTDLQQPIIRHVDPELPRATMNVCVIKKQEAESLFKGIGRRSGIAKPIVSLSKFQEQHGLR